MFVVTQIKIDDNEDTTVVSYGPFRTHQEANSRMQEVYDEMHTDADRGSEGVVYADDSDASHFEIETGDCFYDWYVGELQP